MPTCVRTRLTVLSLSAAVVAAASVSIATTAQASAPDGPAARQMVAADSSSGGYVESGRWLTGSRSHAVAVGGDSVISVSLGDTIDRFDTAGRLLSTFPLGFSSAYGMDVDAGGLLRVTEFGGSPSLVHTVNAAGVELGTYAPPEGVSPNFSPGGIEVLPDGTSFVADETGDTVHRFSADGTWTGRIGETGTGPGQFDAPLDVASSGDGSLFVLDAYNYRVQRFAAAGEFLGMWGQVGYGEGQFLSPVALAVRPDGHVLVLDGDGAPESRLDEFLPDGTFVSRTDLPLSYAGGLDVDGSGTVYVTGLLDYDQGGWGVLALSPDAGQAPPQQSSQATVDGKRLDAISSRRKARLRVTCSAGQGSCAGKVRVQAGRRTLGKGSYAAQAGHAGKVTVRLGPKARRLLRRHAKVRVTVSLVSTRGTGSTRKMTLTR